MENELGNLVKAEVDRAEADLQAFRGRALGVLAVSGGLLTLASGFFAIASGATHQVKITSHERWILAVAFGLYVLSAITALLINIPGNIDLPDSETLEKYVQDDWNDAGWDQQATSVMVRYLSSLKSLNGRNAWNLIYAIAFEIGGILLTAVVAILVIGHVTSV
jgi:hypothetical protein